jgi:hypothetical protein
MKKEKINIDIEPAAYFIYLCIITAQKFPIEEPNQIMTLVGDMLKNIKPKTKLKFNKDTEMTEIMDILIKTARKGKKKDKEDVFCAYVNLIFENNDIDYIEAEKCARKNISYMVGYYDESIRNLIEKSYNIKYLFDTGD